MFNLKKNILSLFLSIIIIFSSTCFTYSNASTISSDEIVLDDSFLQFITTLTFNQVSHILKNEAYMDYPDFDEQSLIDFLTGNYEFDTDSFKESLITYFYDLPESAQQNLYKAYLAAQYVDSTLPTLEDDFSGNISDFYLDTNDYVISKKNDSSIDYSYNFYSGAPSNDSSLLQNIDFMGIKNLLKFITDKHISRKVGGGSSSHGAGSGRFYGDDGLWCPPEGISVEEIEKNSNDIVDRVNSISNFYYDNFQVMSYSQYKRLEVEDNFFARGEKDYTGYIEYRDELDCLEKYGYFYVHLAVFNDVASDRWYYCESEPEHKTESFPPYERITFPGMLLKYVGSSVPRYSYNSIYPCLSPYFFSDSTEYKQKGSISASPNYYSFPNITFIDDGKYTQTSVFYYDRNFYNNKIEAFVGSSDTLYDGDYCTVFFSPSSLNYRLNEYTTLNRYANFYIYKDGTVPPDADYNFNTTIINNYNGDIINNFYETNNYFIDNSKIINIYLTDSPTDEKPNNLFDFLKHLLELLLKALRLLFDLLVDAVNSLCESILSALSTLSSFIGSLLNNILDAILNFVVNLIKGFKDLIFLLFVPDSDYWETNYNDISYTLSLKLPYKQYIDVIESLKFNTPSTRSALMKNNGIGSTTLELTYGSAEFDWGRPIDQTSETMRAWIRGFYMILLAIYNYNQILFVLRGNMLK